MNEDISLLEAAIGFVALLYCVAFWVQSRATAWVTGHDDSIPRAWVIRG